MDSESGAGGEPGAAAGTGAGTGAGAETSNGAGGQCRGQYRGRGPAGVGTQAGGRYWVGGTPVRGGGEAGTGERPPRTVRASPELLPEESRPGGKHPRSGLGVEAGSESPPGLGPVQTVNPRDKESGFLRVNLFRLFSFKSIKD